MDISTKRILGKDIIPGKIIQISCYSPVSWEQVYKPLVVLKITNTPNRMFVSGLINGINLVSCWIDKEENCYEYC